MDVVPYIVVGSGCTGAMAAQTLVEAKSEVLMLDVGVQDETYKPTIPDNDFLSIRREDEDQYRYFIGEQFESLEWGKVGKGEQITPPRKHIFKQVDSYLPVSSSTFAAAESLSYGGLGVGWGIGCWEFSVDELQAAGLQPAAMRAAYDLVCKRIGISAEKDDAAAYTLGSLTGYQKAADMDSNCKLVYAKYIAHKSSLRRRGFTMGRTPLALLTKDLDGRKKYSYSGMDFYSDNEQSAYRPWMTVDMLRKQKNFTYKAGILVLYFSERKDHIEVHCLDTETQQKVAFRCRRLVLGTGVLGSARIAMRSLGKEGTRTPLLCNPYSYVPCVQLARLGKEAEAHKLGFAQLSLFLDETGTGFDVAAASLYSYQSLMLFRLIRQVPLNFVDARHIMQYLSSGIVIMGVHQPDAPATSKYLELITDRHSPSGDRLKIGYAPTTDEVQARQRREKKYMAAARRVGLFPLKRLEPGFGASIHYAGTLPFTDDEQKVCTLSPDGRLHGTSGIYVADGSGFTYLPAKGLTFSLMANAHNVAHNALLRHG